MRTTLTLEEDVAVRIREEMRRSNESYKDVVNRLLRLGLLAQGKLGSAKPFKVRARSLGQRPGLNYDNIGELLEQLEGPPHR